MSITREKASLFSIIIIILQHITTSTRTTPTTINDTCQNSTCGNLHIRFPFQLKGLQPNRCGYPGFELSCTNNNDTVIELPLSGKFLVRNINYTIQRMEIYDQNGCIARRVFTGFNLTGTPFKVDEYVSYTLLNCSRDVPLYDYRIICCLSSPTYRVVYFPSNESIDSFSLTDKCKLADPIKWPWIFFDRKWPWIPYLSLDHFVYRDPSDKSLFVSWNVPECSRCEIQGGNCGYYSNHSIGCFAKETKIAISLSLGVFVSILSGMIIFISVCKKADKEERENQLRIEQFLEKKCSQAHSIQSCRFEEDHEQIGDQIRQRGIWECFRGEAYKWYPSSS
ncbi:hypothetical protein MKX03_027177 [Papaver bracteatum]|nr:hypothetical protein MKX03_027177 [Papaver bracteatum]